MTPVDIVHDTKARTLSVTWQDERVSVLPVDYLRGWCPCAECQGHSNTIRYRPPSDALTIEDIWEVGAYAVGIRFSDGHDKGIYQWRWLRAIRPDAAPSGLKRGRFVGGRYEPA